MGWPVGSVYLGLTGKTAKSYYWADENMRLGDFVNAIIWWVLRGLWLVQASTLLLNWVSFFLPFFITLLIPRSVGFYGTTLQGVWMLPPVSVLDGQCDVQMVEPFARRIPVDLVIPILSVSRVSSNLYSPKSLNISCSGWTTLCYSWTTGVRDASLSDWDVSSSLQGLGFIGLFGLLIKVRRL